MPTVTQALESNFPCWAMEVCLNVNFKEMTNSELRAYIKKHRSDDEAIRELFVNRRSPDETATWYSFPHNAEGLKQGEEVIRSKIADSKVEEGDRFQGSNLGRSLSFADGAIALLICL